MPNKRIRKKWVSRLRKDARRIAKRFKISRQEVGFALSGTIVESTICPDGVRDITDFRLHSVSLVPLYEVRGAGLTVVQDYPDHAVGYDARLFGAVGDGVTDDTGAIQAAINFASGKSSFKTLQEYMQKYPTWPEIVDSSTVVPITDEGRLLK